MDPDSVDEVSAAPRGDGEVSRLCRTVDGSCMKHGGTEPGILDFSAIVNAQTPAGVGQVYESALATAQSYPANDYSGFRATAAEYVGCEATAIVPTAGRLAAVRLAVATTVGTGDVLIPTPNCSEFAREVRLQGAEPTFCPHDELFDTDPGPFTLVVVSQPNNPTGRAADTEQLRAYADRCQAVGTPLLVDESCLGFTDLESLAGRDGVIAARSLSSLSGLPGIRAGFLVATGALGERLDTARLTWGLGTPGKEVGVHCLNSPSFLEATRARVQQERERMRSHLAARFDVSPSTAPFLLLELPEDERVEDLLPSLRESGIAVRDARTFRGLDSHIRVTVRTRDDNDKLLDALGV